MKAGAKRDIRLWIDRYARQRPCYEQYAGTLRRVLECAAGTLAPFGLVQARAKATASFAEKIERKNWKYPNPLTDMTDLCGARVVATTKAEVKALCDFIKAHFDIDEVNSVDIRKRLKPTEFGYLSVHYVVQFRRGEFPCSDVPVRIPERLYPAPGRPMKAEVQVRTLLEHAWATFTHDRSYKSGFRLPPDTERELNALAARLEEADNSFDRILAGLKTLTDSPVGHASEREAAGEARMLLALVAHEPDNPELALRFAELLMTLGRWRQVEKVLAPHSHSGDFRVHLTRGIALVMADPRGAGRAKGEAEVERACRLDRSGANAALARCAPWLGIGGPRTEQRCSDAWRADPGAPETLTSYLVCTLAHTRNTSTIAQMSGHIDTAMARCRGQADAGVNLPWAFYYLGLLNLLQGRPYDSLIAYAKAIEATPGRWIIETALATLDLIAPVKAGLAGYDWVRRLLLLGLASRFASRPALGELRRLATKGRAAFREPVVIVAGGCDAKVDQEMKRKYRQLLVEAFDGFAGTVISGGTTAGISGIAGSIQEAYPKSVTAIGYVPEYLPVGVSVDPRYRDIRKTHGAGFSATEPLQTWTDLLVSGIAPGRVKVIGINGGPISAVDYRMALALGARVAVLSGSGREAGAIKPDTDWGKSPLLLELLPDPVVVNAFVNYRRTAFRPGRVREQVARAIHETYRADHARRMVSADPSMAPWPELLGHLKESNRQQADHIDEKLKIIGRRVAVARGHKPRVREFTKKEVEVMAEAEHARWCVERLADGWKPGPRDPAAKLSPYLVSWKRLPNRVREWDREVVRRIPEMLARVGLEVV